MPHCGHHCCSIADNGYHAHVEPPSRCRRCAVLGPTGAPGMTGPSGASGTDLPGSLDGANGANGAGAGSASPPVVAGPAMTAGPHQPLDAIDMVDADVALLDGIVADVVARVAPQIPDLPAEPELTHHVTTQALAVYAGALADPDLRDLDARARRTVLAARVGLALAFPDS